MRLEIGCGEAQTPGYIHLDVRRPLQGIDIVGDAARLISDRLVEVKSCDEIRANHVLEHIGFRQTANTLTEWCLALKNGGALHVEVPSILGHFEAYKRGEIDFHQLVVYVYGDQDYLDNTHRAAFSAESLTDVLIRAGFTDIQVSDIGMVLVADARRPS